MTTPKENKTLADFLESERNKKEDLLYESKQITRCADTRCDSNGTTTDANGEPEPCQLCDVRKRNLEDLSSHDTRLLAFVREMILIEIYKDHNPDAECDCEKCRVLRPILSLLTPQEPIITTQKPPIEVLEEAVKAGTFSSLTQPTKI